MTRRRILALVGMAGAASGAVVNAPVVRRVQWRSDKIVDIAIDGTLYETSDLSGSWSVLGQVDEEAVVFTSRDSEFWIVTDGAGVLHNDAAPDRPGA